MTRIVAVLAALSAAAVPMYAQDVSVGLQGSYAIQQPFGEGPSSHVRMGLAEVQLNTTLIGDSIASPRLELVNAVMFGQSLRTPGSRFTLGITDTFRVHIRPRRQVDPYVEAGAGISSSAMQVRELNGWLQYVLQAGTGLRIRTGDRTWLTVGYRFVHFSNHKTTLPNEGLNLHTATVGYSFGLRRK